MKGFFKTTFACVLGVFIAGILLFWLFIGSVISLATFPTTPSYTSKENTILILKLEGELTERAKDDPLNILNSGEYIPKAGLDEILKAIQIAKWDNNITGIYLDISNFTGGYASIEEIRNALSDFKKSGKFIVAYADMYTQREYYLATAADWVFMNTIGMLDFRGLSTTPTFYKNTLDKIGVEMQVFRVGTYKSAVEPYITTQMSEANRKQTASYLNSIWETIISDIAEERQIEKHILNDYADSLVSLQEPQWVQKTKLVDSLLYRPEVESFLTQLCGVENINDINWASPTDIVSTAKKIKSKDRIAIVYAVGSIDGISSNGIISDKLVRTLKEVQDDESVKGVVLRVNSPGGSAFGSEQIWHAVEQLKRTKPVAVSMGDYAASGGYYLSCGANRIFANPATLTGSIGIFGLVPNAQKLLSEKIGLSFDEVKTNKYGAFPTIERPMTNDEKQKMQTYINRGYDLFIKRCAQGRKMSVEQIKNIAEGRVWSGKDALKIGLIDELGDMQKATEWIAKKCDITDYEVIEYPKKKSFYEELMNELRNGVSQSFMRLFLGNEYQYKKILDQIKQIDPIQAQMENIELE
ncbi:signal peptide peptidase SppA [Coprobacter fastidiosus]|uniref:signal peptide peptidase SppA n=1 Tax=Coprobacter fastidiosus TaxID=1099853 RepID=UPI002675EE9F|nr:signal peptide peptidase SppA [Coprobacter fastidiosus]